MKLRTINPVPNADAFGMQDCYIIARLVDCSIVTGIHKVVYELEIPYVPGQDAQGNDLPVQYKIKPLVQFDTLVINPIEVNYLLGVMKTDLNAPGEDENGNPVYKFWENIQAAVHEVFRKKVGTDGRFGLTAADWEKR